MNRQDLHRLANARLREARILLEEGEFTGAYYVGGYVVECALKACIARRTQRYDFPDRKTVNDSYTHNLEALLRTAGLSEALNLATVHDPQLGLNWTTVKDWSEESRYRFASEPEASLLYAAIANTRHGVLRWLRLHW